jgi:hypothetical protein
VTVRLDAAAQAMAAELAEARGVTRAEAIRLAIAAMYAAQ